MIQTYNMLSLLLDYPTAELWDSRADILPALRAEGVLSEASLSKVETFLGYVASFADARSWQAAYSDLFDTQTKTNLYLFDMVYGTSRDRGQAMVDLKEEYLKAGLMPAEDELPDYLPMYLQYVANMDDLARARAAIDDIRGVLTKMDERFTFLFQYLPYIAGTLFVCGVTYRIAAQGKTVQAYSTQFLSNDLMLKWGSNLFHVGIILVFFGHIFGLLAPEWAYDWLITNEQKRQLAIVMGSGAGLITLVGISLLTLRRFTNPNVVANSHFGDYLFVVLIFLQIVTGLLGTVETINSDLEHYMNLDRWAQGLFTFLPEAPDFIVHASLAHKIHILLGFLLVIIFPFTKLMHMVALPVRYLIDYFQRLIKRK